MSDFVDIAVRGFEDTVKKMLREYGDVVYKATEEGLTAASYVLMEELREASPKMKNPPKGYKRKNFGKRWKVKPPGKYKLERYVGNTTVVTDKSGNEIPLANILEYSTTRAKPFIKETYEKSIDKMAAAVVAELKKEV